MNPFAEPFMQRAACAIALAAVLGASVGVWVVLRRMALIGDALAHASLPGVVLARWWGIDVYLGGLAAALIAVSGVAGLTRPGRLGEDTALGILMAGSLALGVALAQALPGGGDVQHLLFGSVLGIDSAQLALLGGVTAAVLLALRLLHRPLELASYDPQHADLVGHRPALLRLVLLLLVALAALTIARLLGVLLTGALLVAPAATASLICRDLPRIFPLALAVALGAGLLGLALSFWLPLTPGMAITACAVAGGAALGVLFGVAAAIVGDLDDVDARFLRSLEQARVQLGALLFQRGVRAAIS